MATRTIKRWTVNIRTTLPAPEDSIDMEKELGVTDDVDLSIVEEDIGNVLPPGYYCKIEEL